MADPTVPSPCNSVCRMDGRTGWCLGCLRTIEEIAAWSSLGDAARLEVLERLEERALVVGRTPEARR